MWTVQSKCSMHEGKPLYHGGHPGNEKGRKVYIINPSNSRYYLWTLLHTVKTPTSYEHLKTVDGIVHLIFQIACRALGHLEDDTHWDDALVPKTEATFFQCL